MYFPNIPVIPYEGPNSANEVAFRAKIINHMSKAAGNGLWYLDASLFEDADRPEPSATCPTANSPSAEYGEYR